MKAPKRLTGALSCLTLTSALISGCGSSHSAAGGGGKPAANVGAGIDQAPVVAAGEVGTNIPSTPTIDKIRKRGKLIMAGSHSSVGYSFLDPTTNKIYGFDMGMAELLAKYILGKPNVQVNSGASDAREGLLSNHTVDVAIETYTITPERLKLVNFAGPYLTANYTVVVKKDNTTITKPDDLAGKRVATESGAANDVLLAHYPTAKPVLFDTLALCLTALQQGRADAVTLIDAILLGSVPTKPDLKMLDQTFSSVSMGVGLPKDDPKFKEFVNDWLKKIEADGTWAKLYDATVGKLTHKPAPTPPAIGSVPGT